MIRCPSCAQDAPEDSRYCPACATPLTPSSETATRTSVGRVRPEGAPQAPRTRQLTSPAGRLCTSDSSEEIRFLPGTMLADRYRIVGLLGRGGMGEVYRADDLKVGQTVALKFLPEALAQDERRLERFFGEVRTSRQVTHSNVCRVYDIGEIDGQHYLSMEYVDGEDLASLLRRIGRLPEDRAIQIARQLCAGLAAAHGQGILHRDLKPANVMIDGRGRVRITDFGLAGLAEEIAGGEAKAGTPAYMAPEQLAGEAVSIKSDLYSLGLVLYELFTGKPAYRAGSRIELQRLQQESSPPSPSSLVSGLDPAVERAILRCLERDPRHRPASALAVAAALPGGDPLAAALAAGETPSPEMVADAGEAGGLKPMVALICLVLLLAGLPIQSSQSKGTLLLGHLKLERETPVLADQARQIVQRLGYQDPPIDTAHGFQFDLGYVREVQTSEFTPRRWDELGQVKPAPLMFWYRQSPRYLVPANAVGAVTLADPPARISGMVSVALDPEGRLLKFLAIPPQRDAPTPSITEPDWALPFEAAGLSRGSFSPVPPEWNPLVDCDTRAAWEGIYPNQPDIPIRVEACGYRGKVASFDVIAPWSRPSRLEPIPTDPTTRVAGAVGLSLLGLITLAAILLAWRNLRQGRGDRRGAIRLTLFVFGTVMVSQVLALNHVASTSEIALLLVSAAFAWLIAGLTWLTYMALEPYVRRLWPDLLISWSRLLAGRFRDPLIGRDILVGGSFGLLFATLNVVGVSGLGWMGFPVPAPGPTGNLVLRGLRETGAVWFGNLANILLLPLGLLLLVLLLRVILRRQWLAVGASLFICTSVSALTILGSLLGWAGPAWVLVTVVAVWAGILYSIALFVLIRFGFLAAVFMLFFQSLYYLYPMAFDFSAWYSNRSFFAYLIAMALAVYGFFISRAGRPLLKEDLLPD